MSMLEQPRFFDCAGERLLGIVTVPEARAPLGVVIVVGGPQYRVGSHRQFVLLARALAEAGIASIRFDYRGMGDAEGNVRTFELIDDDVRSAIDTLQADTGVARVALVGLCDGASAALRYCPGDARIVGVAAVNPWARSSVGEAVVRMRHYYARRFIAAAFWRKLLAGAVNLRKSACEFRSTVAVAAGTPSTGDVGFREQMLAGLMFFTGPILLLLSGNDLTAREFEQWLHHRSRRRVLRRAVVRVARIANADHTFSQTASRRIAERTIVDWVRGLVDYGRGDESFKEPVKKRG
jgi:exosortase A-associated hydrolase 1